LIIEEQRERQLWAVSVIRDYSGNGPAFDHLKLIAGFVVMYFVHKEANQSDASAGFSLAI
jgi:hypothetical protein